MQRQIGAEVGVTAPSLPEDRQQINMSPINHHFSGVFEIHRDAPADVGLHLPKAPVGLRRVAHHHTRFQ